MRYPNVVNYIQFSLQLPAEFNHKRGKKATFLHKSVMLKSEDILYNSRNVHYTVSYG